MKLKSVIACSFFSVIALNSTVANADSVCRTPNIVCSGQTTPGSTDWQQYNEWGVTVDIDTSECELNSVPTYYTSMTGTSNHWETTGVSDIYNATETGFRVGIRYAYRQKTLTPDIANGYSWSIHWIAVSTADCDSE